MNNLLGSGILTIAIASCEQIARMSLLDRASD
jgi:hypothetical protein